MAASSEDKSIKPNLLQTWGRLLRVPNLFTVPGDPLAGFLLAAGSVPHWWATADLPLWRAAAAMATSFLIYAAGLLLNDYFDRKVDARERPDRPIPSGAVSASTVLIVGIALLAAGFLLARYAGGEMPGWVAAVLAVAVLAYNAGLKRRKVGGPITMGLCRGGSVLVGAAFATETYAMPPVAIAACVAWVYTASLTFIAAGEASGRRPGKGAHVPGLVLLAGCIAMLKCSMGNIQWPLMTCSFWDGTQGGGTIWEVDRAGVVAVVLLALAVAEAELAAFRVRRGRLPTPAFIGRLIRVMITVQAAWVVWACGPLLGGGELIGAVPFVVAAYLALRWAAALAARRFYGS